MIPLNNYLIITTLGAHRPDLIPEMTRGCTQCGCNLLNTKMSVMGSELVMTLFLSGNWGAIAKMEALLPSLEKRLGISTLTRRTQENPQVGNSMAYTIQLTALDKPGILNGLSEFLFRMGIEIEDANSHTYSTHTNTQMFAVTLRINIPSRVHLATLRDKFLGYCDDQNFDGFLEPIRATQY